MPDFVLKSHDRLPSIQAILSSGGNPVDLSAAGTSVKFIMKTAQGNTIKVNAAATIVTANSGVVRYDWLATDTDTAGEFLAEWQVTFSGGKTQTFPTTSYHSVSILADLDGA